MLIERALLGVDDDVVDQAELVDVDGNLRVEDGLDDVDDLAAGTRRSAAGSSGPICGVVLPARASAPSSASVFQASGAWNGESSPCPTRAPAVGGDRRMRRSPATVARPRPRRPALRGLVLLACQKRKHAHVAFNPAAPARDRAPRRAHRCRRRCCTSRTTRAPSPECRSDPSPAARSDARCESPRLRDRRSVPMSCGWMSSMTNDTTLALLLRRADDRARPARLPTPSVAYASSADSCAPIASKPIAADVIDRRAQPDRARDVRRAGFELVRQVVPGALLERDGAESCRRRRGTAASRRAPASRPYSTPMPVGP